MLFLSSTEKKTEYYDNRMTGFRRRVPTVTTDHQPTIYHNQFDRVTNNNNYKKKAFLSVSTFSPLSDADAKSAQLFGLRRVAISHQGTSDGSGGNAADEPYDDFGLIA